MAVLLSRGYAGYATNTVVNLPAPLEASLVAQGFATVSAVASTTTGAVTANLPSGICAVAASSASIVITNNMVDATSNVFAVVAQAAADATALRVERIVCAAGSFTINLTAAATATTLVKWCVVTVAGDTPVLTT